VHRTHHRHHRRTWRQFFKLLGPGVVSGAADNDPSGVVTYIQVGATTGFGLLWLLLLSTPILYYLEEMSTRLGAVTKRGIGRVLRMRYGPAVAVGVVVPVLLSNIITIGADLSGTAAALQLVTGLSWTWWVGPLAAALAAALVFASYRIISRFLLVLTPLFLLYVVTGFIVHPHWEAVLRATFLPKVQLSPSYLEAALGLLGATLTPYMFFWQTTEEVEAHRTVDELAEENLDVAVGMVYANLIFYFIILVAGAVLHRHGSITTVAEAASSLRPLAGPFASLLFALGVVVSGILSIPVMAACSAYALAEALGWVEGLDRRVWQARGFYTIILGSLGVGAGIAHLHIAPVTLMYWSQILNGLLLPPLFTVLLLLCNDRRIVRRHTNRTLSNLVGWATVLLTLALAVLALRPGASTG
jgi:Mn2+/Fe2+ NRAMP family transporter